MEAVAVVLAIEALLATLTGFQARLLASDDCANCSCRTSLRDHVSRWTPT
jgi:hypothetical protein